jgi:hypothetical protein
MEVNMYYVTMDDTFLSYWGMSEGKINKLVVECRDLEEARTVERNAKDRTDQEHISVIRRDERPYFSGKKYYTSFKTKNDMPRWFESGRPFQK